MTAGGPLARLNAMGEKRAVEALSRVCGSRAWARDVAAARPFADREALLAAAEAAWDGLDPEEWREAFDAHPRIGETAGGWSKEEQAGAADADAGTLAELAECQRAYEERFGHVFLIRAEGRPAREILAACRARLDHDPWEELRVAASQERQIGRRRIDRLLEEGFPEEGESG
ncbi:MAG: 2-oxo-4-hydroxy-4-carboxy-5-ureidoimidazoline decarboxylase [Gemmatimonadota bacterium]|nr:2-oxo-4-hydroxy-4-carboxy-5-ureidoimidazoline decarboxylase [Gemmatimonadota bacterium]